MTTFREAIEKIRDAKETRIVPLTGSDKVKLEILTPGGWVTVWRDVSKNIAEDMIRQSRNRILLG